MLLDNLSKFYGWKMKKKFLSAIAIFFISTTIYNLPFNQSGDTCKKVIFSKIISLMKSVLNLHNCYFILQDFSIMFRKECFVVINSKIA